MGVFFGFVNTAKEANGLIAGFKISFSPLRACIVITS